MKITLNLRNDTHGSKAHFYAERGRERWSILDCGELMKSSLRYESLVAAGMFMGWEALKIREDGTLDHDSQVRAETWGELEKLLTPIK